MARYSQAQLQLAQKLIRIGKQQGASSKEIKAAIETAIVESNLSNPSGGDADSAGWRQERASLYPDPTNVQHSAERFYRETAQVRGKYGRAGDLAAAVQRPAAQYRGRYQQVAGQASSLLKDLGGSLNSGGANSSSTTTYSPGVDNSQQRKQLLLSYLLNRDNPNALLDLAAGLQNAQDTPGTYKTTTRSTASSAPSGTGRGKSKLLELIYNSGQGSGYAVKNGQKVDGPSFYSSVWAGHRDHVHVAAGPKTVVRLGKLAQSMGLHVGENPHFGGVSPVHVKDSYHYKGEAIDVSGDPARMRAFAKRVERSYGIR